MSDDILSCMNLYWFICVNENYNDKGDVVVFVVG